MTDHFVNDEPQELLAEGGIETRVVCQRPQPGDLDGFSIGICGGKADLGLMFSNSLGDLESFSQ